MTAKVRALIARIKQLTLASKAGDVKNLEVQDAFVALGIRMRELLERAQPDQDYLRALRIVVAVEHLLKIRDEINRPSESSLLVFAMAAARDGYRQGLRSITAAGISREGAIRWPEPVVLFEPMATPMTLNRGGTASLSFTGARSKAIPFPMVFIPAYPESSLGSLCVIQHEIGHNLDEDFDLTERVAPKFEAKLLNQQQNNQMKPQDIDTWVGWTTELLADFFGVLLGGIALGIELAEWAEVVSDESAMASATHPYPSVRVSFVVELMKKFGVDLRASKHPEFDCVQVDPNSVPREVAKYVLQVPIAINALVETPIEDLNYLELRDLAVHFSADHEHLCEAAKSLRHGSQPEIIQNLPLRLLPSAAKLASAGSDLDQDQLFDNLQQIVRDQGDNLAVRFRRAEFVKQSMEDIEPPILDEEQDGLKRPPINLFREAKQVSFVGASNDSLPGLFEGYAKDPKTKPKRKIDIFYLSENALQRLAHDGRTKEDLVAGRRKSLAGLTPNLMDQVALQWRVFEHDEPYFFAAYFDAGVKGAGRIHISSHGWGQDIKYAPSVDHIWPSTSSQPNRKYRWYRKALHHLTSRATCLRSSSR